MNSLRDLFVLLTTFCLLLSLHSVAHSHALAPSLLELTAVPGSVEESSAESQSQLLEYSVLWKTPKKKEAGVDLRPILPAVCSAARDASSALENTAVVIRYTVDCSEPIEGKVINIQDLNVATTNVVVRYIDSESYKHHWLLSNDKTFIEIPMQKDSSTVFVDYLELGVEHLIGGIDHVLFVIALLFLLPIGKALIIAITAFTLGHSVTLALSALDLLTIPQQPIEILIAVTIMMVASDIIRAKQNNTQTWLQRHPGLMTGSFGLIHGLGFAGVLGEIGLPVADKVLALFAFNVGIEFAQLLIVLVWLFLARLLFFIDKRYQSIKPRLQMGQHALAYGIGGIGGYWVFDRSFSLIGF